jgi:thioredoxin-like negative regulator of GroEL
MVNQIITEIRDRNHFMELQRTNPGLLILKFGAKWCKPCNLIAADIKKVFEQSPSNVQTCIIDIDDNFDVYAYLHP